VDTLGGVLERTARLGPVIEVVAHEGCAQRRGPAALLRDDHRKLEAAVNVENLVSVLEAIEPAPGAAVEQEASQVYRALVGVEAARSDEPELTAALQERVRLF